MRFGLRTTTEPHSAESQRADHRGTCCNFLQVHRELSSVDVAARTQNAHIDGLGMSRPLMHRIPVAADHKPTPEGERRRHRR
jgi:hypothetical protein